MNITVHWSRSRIIIIVCGNKSDLHRSPKSRSRSEKFLKSSTFWSGKEEQKSFFEDLLDMYMDLERILERFISKKFLWFRIGKTRI